MPYACGVLRISCLHQRRLSAGPEHYQAVKGMTAAEGTVNGGVIIMAAGSEDSHGGQVFRTFRVSRTWTACWSVFSRHPGPDGTIPDQWQSQVHRGLREARVIYVSSLAGNGEGALHASMPADCQESASGWRTGCLEGRMEASVDYRTACP